MAANAGPVAQECVEAYIFAGRPPRLLVLRRPPSRDRIWVPVSGKVDPTDADLESALRRELAEETGFSSPKRVFPLDWQVPFDGPDGRVWRLHAFGVELEKEEAPRLSAEHEAFEWVTSTEALHRLFYADNRQAVTVLLERLHFEGMTRPASSPNV